MPETWLSNLDDSCAVYNKYPEGFFSHDLTNKILNKKKNTVQSNRITVSLILIDIS